MHRTISTLNASKKLLSLEQSPDNYIECETLVNIILGSSPEWIRKNGLTNVTIRLLALQRHRSSAINGTMLAMYAKRLIAAEERVGGPYSYKSEDKDKLNKLIALLFYNFGKPLPQLNDYLIGTIYRENSEKKPKMIEQNPLTNTIRDELERLPISQKKSALAIWESIILFDKSSEITMLSKFFYESLNVKPDIPNEFFINVSIANFYAWMAYSIYDDLIDGEDKISLLPLANILQRRSLYRYLKTSNDSFIQTFYDKVDDSNFYEINNLRFFVNSDKIRISKIPDFKDGKFLADRAIGHILGPAIIIHEHLKIDESQKDSLYEALDYFLIAKQLNDDAHDWIEDLKNGHASYVVAFLLDKARVEPGVYSIELITDKLRSYFWQSGLNEISNLTMNYLERSLGLFEKTRLFNMSGSFFQRVLDPIWSTAKKSINILDDQKLFLMEYKKLQDD